MSHTVSLIRCPSYDLQKVAFAIRDSLGAIGFDLNSTKGKRVLLKPNMLAAYPPHKHVTTHPAFVEAAATLFDEAGAHVMIGDSHNGVYPTDEVWNVTGIRKAAELSRAMMAPFEKAGSIEKDGLRFSKQIFEADLMVNLPKFKTHGLTILTCAVKNLYGCVPGMVKTAYHRELIDRRDFALRLLEIANTVKPGLTIMDAITGMDGNGPSGGNPFNVGLVIAGRDLHSVDAICCRLVGLDPLELDTLAHAHSMGMFDPEADITVAGCDIEACRPKGFRLPSTYVKKQLDGRIAKRVLKLIWNNMSVRPAISSERCRRCGLCIKSCPVKAIDWKGNDRERAPLIDKKTCIQCFCCHETCPHQAIDLKPSLLTKMGQWMGRRRAKKRNTEAGSQ